MCPAKAGVLGGRQSLLGGREGKMSDPYASFGNRNYDTMIERFRVMGDNIVEVHVNLFGTHVPQTKDDDTCLLYTSPSPRD